MRRKAVLSIIVAGGLLAMPRGADAYIGPGAGISVIGTVVAFVGAIVFAIAGFVWYPLKRLIAVLRNRKRREHEDQQASVS